MGVPVKLLARGIVLGERFPDEGSLIEALDDLIERDLCRAPRDVRSRDILFQTDRPGRFFLNAELTETGKWATHAYIRDIHGIPQEFFRDIRIEIVDDLRAHDAGRH